jgi:hypothetical protein
MKKAQEKPIDEIKIIGQFTGFKILAIGGARLSIDLYEERANDYALATELCRRREVVNLTISPYKGAEKGSVSGGKKNQRKAGEAQE